MTKEQVTINDNGNEKEKYYKLWMKAGFIAREAKELTYGSKGVNVNAGAVYESEVGISTRISRKNYINSLIKQGLSLTQINESINNFYVGRESSAVWDFIRKDYVPSRGANSNSNKYIEAIRTQADKNVYPTLKRKGDK